jgi:drug/metabolite transporter (DMT)-like permease
MDIAWDSLIGPGAGLATSALWTATSIFFTAAARRIGPTRVNTFRILLAVLLHAITYRVLAQGWWPDADPRQVAYLALSGVVGLAIGDQALFVAFLYIGPRMAVLLATTAPLFATLFGYLALGETLPPIAWTGMLITVLGVAWVVLERRVSNIDAVSQHFALGLGLAVLAAACQAAGMMLSKKGMGHGWLEPTERLDPQAATLVRMFFAAVAMIPVLCMRGLQERRRRRAGLIPPSTVNARAGFGFMVCGAILGPYLGVWMSLIATDRAPVGIAQTLCSLPPVMILPFAAWLYKERITWRSFLGAVIALGGCTLLLVDRAAG